MASFNKVILIGNLTRDPELKYTPKGTAVAKIGLAVNRSWKTDTGETREEVTFIDVDAFGRQAEVIGQYLKKGRPLMVEGRLKLDQWDDKTTGQKRSRLGVVLESFQFLDSGRGGEGGGAGAEGGEYAPREARAPQPRPTRPAPAAPAAAASDPDMPPVEDDDVPF
ncbi:MAG: ssb [Verrucomicrobia bacterium]|jgi:single-strand DNA-binding protein|nr:ssb [Verrucomicrobiota bacterium]